MIELRASVDIFEYFGGTWKITVNWRDGEQTLNLEQRITPDMVKTRGLFDLIWKDMGALLKKEIDKMEDPK